MTRAYIRLDPAFDERKEGYPDGPYAALVATLCLAEAQPMRGRFRSVAYLKALLGRRGRHLPYLMAHGDIDVLPDGRPYVVGWDEWQEGDWKVGERVHRIRNRRGMNGVRNALGNGPRNGEGNGGTVQGERLDLSEVSAGGDADKAVTADRASATGLKPIGELMPGVAEKLRLPRAR